MPYKRAASEKSGLPVYQPTGVQQQQQQQQQQQLQQQQAAYHQILQIQQQPSIVPATATCEYSLSLSSLKSKVKFNKDKINCKAPVSECSSYRASAPIQIWGVRKDFQIALEINWENRAVR